MLHKEVTKHYKNAPINLETALNREASILASTVKLENRVKKFNIKNCFKTLKDNKSNFRSNPECRLINPSEMQMAKINKVILQEICVTIRIALHFKQWCSTSDCIKWFKNYDKNNKYCFVTYDIKVFYSSVTEKNNEIRFG